VTDADAHRVLVLAPRGRDAELMQAMLARYGLVAETCATTQALLSEMSRPAGCAVLTQEALDSELQVKLSRALAEQPAWSDFPLIVLVNQQAAEASQVLAVELGNVTVIERPLAPQSLLTAVHAALRARRRQYEARAAIQQRDQFLAMLGHELRNPLGAIVLASQLARSGFDRVKLDERLALIERQSNLLARLVDDLLDVARVTTGKVRLRSEAVRIDDTIKSSISTLADRARERAMSIAFTSASGAVVAGDSVRLEQVINNLLSNAIKYSPAGRTVRVSSAIEDDTCVVRVRDQGIGIAADMQARVFDLFAQADGSLERAEGGMGIGLTLVDRLVRLHGGSVRLTSEGLGHGTEVTVRLPLAKAATPANVIDFPTGEIKDLRVVLVEDNADIRELTRDLLEMLGCKVELAMDGQEGLSLIVSSKPDLALVDIGLPVIDGYEIAREVRKQLGNQIMLVAASGYGLEPDRESSMRAGFDLHVTKPLDINTLRQLIARAGSERDSRQQDRAGLRG
jgi:signal transduction histidine kinase/ActR/RegA family two-component response regulator